MYVVMTVFFFTYVCNVLFVVARVNGCKRRGRDEKVNVYMFHRKTKETLESASSKNTCIPLFISVHTLHIGMFVYTSRQVYVHLEQERPNVTGSTTRTLNTQDEVYVHT